jgi:phosphoribosylformylglycinamidine synthase PurS subunit
LKFKARIEVRPKGERLDPESETIKRSLLELGFQLSQVRTSKVYELSLDAGSKKEAEASAKLMCSRLLVNPTKDDYKLEVEPVVGSRA